MAVSRVKPRRRRSAPSTELHDGIILMQWVRGLEKEYPILTGFFHIPNGGGRGLREAANMKRAGVKAGVPDYCLPTVDGCLWIELKRTKGGRVRKNQVEWAAHLRGLHGHLHHVCYGWVEAARAIAVRLAIPERFVP